MKEACHHNLYAIANSQAMNGIGANTTIKAVTPGITPLTTTIAVVLWAVFAASLVLWILKRSKFKKAYVYIPAGEAVAAPVVEEAVETVEEPTVEVVEKTEEIEE